MIRIKLLDLPLDPSLRRIFDEDVGPAQDIGVKLRLAGAIAADGVDMHPGADKIVGQDRGVALIGGAGGDDLRARHRLFL